MADEKSNELRKHLTFAQAEGAEPLPTQLQLGEVSAAMRAELWNVVYSGIRVESGMYSVDVRAPWLKILRDKHVFHEHRMADNFDSAWKTQMTELRAYFERGNYVLLLGLIQFFLRHRATPSQFGRSIDAVLRRTKAAYRVVDGDTIAPFLSESDRATVERAFADLAGAEFHGAKAHLKAAAEAASQGDNPGSVRESIQAVESVARMLAPDSEALAPALSVLEAKAGVHGAMKKGFSALYGYASDEKGIRYPLLNDPANVDEVDALFMLGACSAFVSYQINKARSVGILV